MFLNYSEEIARFKRGGAAPAHTPVLYALPSNTRWFTKDGTRAVYLSGSQTWNTLQDWGTGGTPQAINFTDFVSMLVSNGHNFTLLWRTELPKFSNLPYTSGTMLDFSVTPHPWLRTGPGNATDGGLKFDLTRFDDAFFDRLRSRIIQLGNAGIYAGVYLFTGEWLNVFRSSTDGHPLTGANNINSVDDGGGNGAYTMGGTNAVSDIQDALVNKYVDILNDLSNVIWIVSEEAVSTSTWWNDHIISHLRTYQTGKSNQHPIGIGVLSDINDIYITNSNADWLAVGANIAGNTTCGTGTPSCKVVINDSDHSYFGMWNDSTTTNRNWLWKNFLNGNSTAFMDPYLLSYTRESRNVCGSPNNGICATVDTRWNNFRANMGATVQYGNKIDLANMPPQTFSSTGYCLARSDKAQFLAYQPGTGAFTLNVATKSYNYEWWNPSINSLDSSGTVAGTAGDQTFTPPFSGDAVLWLKEVGT